MTENKDTVKAGSGRTNDKVSEEKEGLFTIKRDQIG